MKWYPIKTPGIVKRIFDTYTWRFSSYEKTLYLTFDDGPTPSITEFVLSELSKYNAKATFFCIGKNIAQYPILFNRIVEEGHSIGNHTNNHLKGWKTSTKAYLENTLLCEDVIHSTRIKPSLNAQKLFRPPYGKITYSQAKKIKALGYNIVMWDVLSADFDKRVSKKNCLQNVIKHAQNGSIIVFHDSDKAAKNLQFALPKVLEEFTKQGYVFKAI